MTRSTLFKIIIPLLFILAAILGLAQRKNSTQVYNFNNDGKLQQELLDFYNRGQELNPQTQNESKVSFLAVGDIMLSRNVAAEIKKSGDVDLPFKNMADVLKATNFNFANLESPFSPPAKEGCPDNSRGGVVGGHSMVFGAPCKNILGLKDYNFKIVNLANNHALDQGLSGLNYTLKYLDDNGIKHVGAGKNLDEAGQPAEITQSGIKICFIGASYASVNDNGKASNTYVARIEDKEKLKTAILSARQSCDFVVVTMHAGTEYTRTPNQNQIAFAHAAIEDGADVVVGAHPHWVQAIEKYCPLQSSPPFQGGVPAAGGGGGWSSDNKLSCPNPKYIFYSLGNFIFDQEWSQDTKEGLTLKITVSKNGGCSPSPLLRGDVPSASEGQRGCGEDLQGTRQPAKLDSVELVPIILENYSTPRPATADEAKKILDKIGVTGNILK